MKHWALFLGCILPASLAQGELELQSRSAQEPSSFSLTGRLRLSSKSIREQQQALHSLTAQPEGAADETLLAAWERYEAGDLPPALWLELFSSSAQRSDPRIRERLAQHDRQVASSRDPLRPYRECLEGGDAAAGREIFMKRPEAGCVRCHRLGEEGKAIGPDLSKLGQATDRVYILESIVDPNATIAPGFQNVLLKLRSGETVTGLATFETTDELVLTSVIDGHQSRVKTVEITERTPLPSAMPPGYGLVLGKAAIRDLVEFLAAAK